MSNVKFTNKYYNAYNNESFLYLKNLEQIIKIFRNIKKLIFLVVYKNNRKK